MKGTISCCYLPTLDERQSLFHILQRSVLFKRTRLIGYIFLSRCTRADISQLLGQNLPENTRLVEGVCLIWYRCVEQLHSRRVALVHIYFLASSQTSQVRHSNKFCVSSLSNIKICCRGAPVMFDWMLLKEVTHTWHASVLLIYRSCLRFDHALCFMVHNWNLKHPLGLS